MKNDMNERIQKLAKQAGLEGSNGHYEYDWFDPDKFAELIVRECIDIVKQRWINPDEDVIAKEIKQHFGVEE